MDKQRVLFLDDDENRHNEFYKNMSTKYELTMVWTAEECIQMLEENPKFFKVFLDHDLGGQTYVQSGKETGYEVAEYIRDQLPKDKYPAQILIHSYNPAGAANMADAIYDSGIPFIQQPFGPSLFEY